MPGTARLHYCGYDLDLGVPLGSIAPIKRLLEGHADSQVRNLLSLIDKLRGLSAAQQLVQIEAIQDYLAAHADAFKAILTEETFGELQSWLSFLHDRVAAESRPRLKRDRRGHWRWWAQRERFLMRHLDEIVEALDPDDKLVLLGHNVHLCKDASHLYFHPQPGPFWGLRSWLGAVGYQAVLKRIGFPLNMGSSVGEHLYRRFPEEVLSIWMLYGQGTLMTPKGPRTVHLRGDTLESLLARVGDRFLLPLREVDPQAKTILSQANTRLAGGSYAAADLATQADAIYFVREVSAV